MEIKHLRSDFIRSFLFKVYNQPVKVYDLDNEEDLKFCNATMTDTISMAPSIILSNGPINESICTKYPGNLSNSILNDNYSRRWTHIKDINDNKHNLIAVKDDVIILDKSRINTQEYYLTLMPLLKKYISSPEHIIELLDNKSYEQLVTERNNELNNTFNSYIEQLPNTATNALNQKINSLQEQITLYLNKINEIKSKLKTAYGEKITSILNNNNPFKDLLKYLNKCKQVAGYRVNQSNSGTDFSTIDIKIYTNWLPLAYTYGEQALKKMVIDNASLKENNNKDILMDALGNRKDYEIMLLPIRIDIIYDVQRNYLEFNMQTCKDSLPTASRVAINTLLGSTGTSLWNRIVSGDFKNYHYFGFTCYGGFRADIEEARTQINPVRLFATLLQYMTTINITDAAGTSWIKQRHIIRNKQTNKWFLYNPINGMTADIPNYMIKSINWDNVNAYKKEDNYAD